MLVMGRSVDFSNLSEDASMRLKSLGARIRTARLRRRMRLTDVAARTGLARSTVEAVERGSLTTSFGAYLAVLWLFGLDRELDLVADPGLDRDGLALTLSREDKRVRVARVPDNDF
jgi:transcriptional regulator with XRE-family HTH domain